jgi:hypothetical protein
MNPQIPSRHFGVAADRQRHVALLRHAPNASSFADGKLAFREAADPRSAPIAFRADDSPEVDFCGIAQKCCFQRHLISPGINTYKNSHFSCIPLISEDFNSTKNNSSGNKDLKSIRINTSGSKDLKSFRINTSKKQGRGVGLASVLAPSGILAIRSQGLSLPRVKPFASLGDSPLGDATS